MPTVRKTATVRPLACLDGNPPATRRVGSRNGPVTVTALDPAIAPIVAELAAPTNVRIVVESSTRVLIVNR